MRKPFLLLLCMLCAMLTTQTFAQKKVHTIGDSTMDSYAGGGTDKMGWCGVLQQFLNGKDASNNTITVNNRGKSGASSRTFYTDERLWPTMVTGGTDAMKQGDILLIQFAHNDENNKGMDALELKAYNEAHGGAAITDLRGTIPTTTYKQYLRMYINEAKAMGVKPILVGAICRNYFNGATIKNSGVHNLADGYSILTETGVQENQKLTTDDHSMDYTYQMGEVAKEFDDVPFINFTQGTKELFEGLGSAYCSANIFNVGDGTHTGMMGATLVARQFAKTLQTAVAAETSATKKAVLEELAQYVSLNSDIALTPSSADMGKTYVGTPVIKTFSIAGFDLVPATGKATISATEDYLVSLDKETYSESVEINIEGGNAFASVYVKGTPSAEGVKAGTLTVSYGEITRTADLSIEGIVNTSGTESSVTFALNSANTGTVVGDIIAGSEVIEGMVVGSGPTATIGDVAFRRYKVDGVWPNNIDEVSTRYVQLSAEVPEGKNFRLDKISLDYSASGTNNMNCKIYYSTDADFKNEVLIKEHHSLANNTANSISVMPMRELTAGDKIYVRVYPWINADGQSGKYICLSNLVIHGYAEDIPQYTEETTTWDFSEFTTQVDLNEDLNYSNPKYAYEYTKDDMTLLCVGTKTGLDSKNNKVEYLNTSYGFHCNGASSATTRYIQFTPQYDGKFTVSYRSNNTTATDRIVAIGTAVKTFSPIPEVLDEAVLAAGLTNGATIQTISADLTAGTTYYAYFASGGSSISKLQYDYKKPYGPGPGPEPEGDYPRTATWDFTAMAVGAVNVQSGIKEGDVASDIEEVSMHISQEGGKFYAKSGDDKPYAQMNANTTLQIPVTNTADVITLKSYYGYSYTIGGVEATSTNFEYTATKADVKQGYAEVVATNTWYPTVISVVQNGPEGEFTETHATYKWDFQNGNPTTVTSIAYEKNSGTAVSTEAQISTGNAEMPKTINLTIDATNGKFTYREANHDIQMNKGTILRVPVISTDDEVTVVCRSNASYLYVHDAVAPTTAIKATFGDKSQGYMEFIAKEGSPYLYCITVTQVKKPASQEPELAAVKLNGETYGAEIFKAGEAEGLFNAAIKIASTATLPSSTNAVEAIVEAGEAGTITYTPQADNSVDVVIPVTLGELTYTYTLNVANKAAHTVTYYDVDGTTVIGTQTVDDGETISAYAYDEKNVTVAQGEVFRGWYDGVHASSLKVPVTTVIDADKALYARCGAPIAPVDGVYYIEENDGDMLMETIKAAQNNTTINIPDGTYYFGTAVLTTLSASNVTLKGESMDGVIIENEPPASQESINNTATILNKGTGNKFVNLTLKNSLDYYKNDNGRAVCLQDEGTKTICKNVRMLSYQDTYYSHKANGLYYFEDCDIHGTVDFICGNGTAYFKDTQLYAEKRAKAGGGSDALTANASSATEKGYVFEGCTIVSECPTLSLGRSWNQAPQCVYINTVCDFSKGEFTFTGNGIQRWTTAGMNVLPHKFGEYNTTLKNATRAASDVVTPASNIVHFTYGTTSIDMETVMTAADAASYTVENVLGAEFKQEIDDFIGSLSAIKDVNATVSHISNHMMYNIAGQRVNNLHKGIVIVDGKKYVK